MHTLSVSEAKMKLSSLVESVNTTDEEVIVTQNGRPVAVLVSPDEFESWRETISVHSDSDLMKEIRKGLAALKKGKASLLPLRNFLNNFCRRRQ